MLRPILIIAAAGLASAPAVAASYAAKPVVPTTERFIARDIVWSCGPEACQGSTDESRPAVLCQSLAKRAGRIESFLVDGRAFGVSELAQCNSAAKALPNSAIAAQ